MKEFTKIKEEELSVGVTSLPLRPNQTTQFGQSPLSGKELQACFDRLAKEVLATKINELIGILSSTDVLSYFKINDDEALDTFVATLKNNLSDDGKISATDPAAQDKKTVDIILSTLYSAIEAVKTFTNYAEGEGTIADIYATIEALKQANRAISEETSARQTAVSNLKTELEGKINTEKTAAISAADANADSKIDAHNSSNTAHGDIRSAIVSAKENAISTATSNAKSEITAHNTNGSAHNDIRLELKALADRIDAALDSDDKTLDELSEIVAYIKSNKTLIDAITTSKVSVIDIVDDLITNVNNKPLSAAQGVVLKGLIDALTESKADKSINDTVINLSQKVANVESSLGGKIDKASITSNLNEDSEDKVMSQKAGNTLSLIISEIINNGTGSGGFSKEINEMVLQVFGTDGSFALEYDIDMPEDGKAIVLSIGECTETDIVIGSRVLERAVTSIAEAAFKENSTITSIVIPDTVTSLGSWMCSGCTELKTVKIGSGVSLIASYAFKDCSKLKTVYLDKNVTKFATNAFESTKIETVYYSGTEAEWRSIERTTGNDSVDSATVIYNYAKEARNESYS